MGMIEIRDAAPSDWPAWQPMWSGYCTHYGTALPDADVRELWRRIADPGYPIAALVAGSASGTLIGFAHFVLRPHTFSTRMVCYLEDLWVEPAGRGQGIGRRLIETLVARGRDRGWRRLSWHTEADNAAARALYDRIARLTEYVCYDIALP